MTEVPRRTEVKSSEFCFACGRANETGLRMEITGDARGCQARFRPRRRHEGFTGIVHGGIVATLLDEMIAWACQLQGHDAVTGELTVRYRRPVPLDDELLLHGRITREHGRLMFGAAELRDSAGQLLASASAKMMR